MILKIVVKTGSKKGPLVEQKNDQLTAFLRSRPHDGEANEELIKLLSKYFHTPKTSIKIKSGQKSHTKIIEFPD